MNAPEITGPETGKKPGKPSANKAKKASKASKANLKAKKRRPAKPHPAKLRPAKPRPVKPRSGAAHSTPPLIVWSADPGAGQPLIRLLQKTRALQDPGALPDPGEIVSGAQAPEMLLLCFSPAQTLCRQMVQGTPPAEALEIWMVQAGKVLAVNRRNRRRVHILDLDQALRDPVTALARFGLPDSDLPDSSLPDSAQNGSDPGPDVPGVPENVSDPPDPVLLLLAQRCLSGNPRARALAGELEAATAAVDPPGDDPDAAFRAWREAGWAREEAGLLQVQTRMMLEEIELVQQQNRAAHEEVASLGQARVQLEQQSEARLAQMSQGIESYQAQLQELQATKARLSGRLAEKESAMDAAGAAQRDLEAQLGDLTSSLAGTQRLADTRLREIDALQARVERFETSHSYRLTAPLRALRGLISGRGKEGGRG